MLKLPPDKMRVITPDVGGGFGTKLFPYREYALAAVAAERLRKPVKWVCERTEHFLGDSHGRDNISTARLALDDKGRFLALDLDIVADMGAYLSCYAPYIPWLGVGMATGAYDIPAAHVRLRAAYTNTVPVDAYRGAGRPEASYLIERLVDAAARDLDMAPDTLRRRNFIKPKAMPYTTPTGKIYDSGDFAGRMARAQEIADWDGFNKRAAASKRAGKLRGIGIATYIEACGNNGPETANVRLERDGGVTVLIGSQSTGQGHATSYAQLVAERLDLPPERVRVVQGDTDRDRDRRRHRRIEFDPRRRRLRRPRRRRRWPSSSSSLPPTRWKPPPTDMEIADGAVRVAGTDRVISFADLAARPQATPEQLARRERVRHRAADLPERHAHRRSRDRSRNRRDRDPQLRRGRRFRRHAQSAAARRPGAWRRGAGHRPGADGRHGLRSGLRAIAQRELHGLRACRARPTRRTSCSRRATCRARTIRSASKARAKPGAIGSCPAVINAILDALWRAYRIRHIDMPATPQRVWAAIAGGAKSRISE